MLAAEGWLLRAAGVRRHAEWNQRVHGPVVNRGGAAGSVLPSTLPAGNCTARPSQQPCTQQSGHFYSQSSQSSLFLWFSVNIGGDFLGLQVNTAVYVDRDECIGCDGVSGTQMMSELLCQAADFARVRDDLESEDDR